jgi:hypothetical protein
VSEADYLYTSGQLKGWLHASAAHLAELDQCAPAEGVDRWFYLNARKTELAYLEETAGLLVTAYDGEDNTLAANAAEEVHEHYLAESTAADKAVETARPEAVRLLQPHLAEPEHAEPDIDF